MNIAATAEKLSKFFGLDDSDENDNLNEKQTHTVKPKTNSSSPKRSRFQNEKEVENFDASERVVRTQQEEYQEPVENVRIPKKVVPMSKGEPTNLRRENKGEEQVKKISIIEPRTYTEAKDIAKCVFRNEIVIISFHLIEEKHARRIIDFLTGTVYAIDGDIRRIGDEMFICTPANTEIDSETAKSLLNNQFADY